MGLYTSIHYRWMLFVDGENLTLRAQEFAKNNNINLVEGTSYMRDVFVWPPGLGRATTAQYENFPGALCSPHAVRAYYYTSVVGDEPKLKKVSESLRNLAFEPKVFKKSANRKSKGVDISLTKDFLSNAFLNNYEFVALIAGDADYIPLVEEVKRLGKIVYIAFLSCGLSQELRLAADWFGSLDKLFLKQWGTFDK